MAIISPENSLPENPKEGYFDCFFFGGGRCMHLDVIGLGLPMEGEKERENEGDKEGEIVSSFFMVMLPT